MKCFCLPAFSSFNQEQFSRVFSVGGLSVLPRTKKAETGVGEAGGPVIQAQCLSHAVL